MVHPVQGWLLIALSLVAQPVWSVAKVPTVCQTVRSCKQWAQLTPPAPRSYQLGPEQPPSQAELFDALASAKECTLAKVTRAVVRRDLVLDGRTIPIVLVATAPPAERDRRARRLAEVAARLPPYASRLLTQFVAFAAPRPTDRCDGRQAGMTALGSGLISVFPHGFEQDEATLARNLVHEVGHTVSLRAWGDDPQSAAWWRWREAVAADGAVPSHYGNGRDPRPRQLLEDFADASALYLLSLPYPKQHARFKSQIPARFELVARLWEEADTRLPSGGGTAGPASPSGRAARHPAQRSPEFRDSRVVMAAAGAAALVAGLVAVAVLRRRKRPGAGASGDDGLAPRA
jgi:hypothetical protein